MLYRREKIIHFPNQNTKNIFSSLKMFCAVVQDRITEVVAHKATSPAGRRGGGNPGVETRQWQTINCRCADVKIAGPCTFWEVYKNEDLKQTGKNYKSIYCMNIPKTKANLSTPSKSACSMAITPTSANNCSG